MVNQVHFKGAHFDLEMVYDEIDVLNLMDPVRLIGIGQPFDEKKWPSCLNRIKRFEISISKILFDI